MTIERIKVKGSSHATVYDKPKPTIQKIVLTEDQKQEVKDILDGKPTKIMVERWNKSGTKQMTEKSYRAGSMHGRKEIIKKNYYHGLCHICQDWPAYKVLYKLPDVTVLEFYCAEHFSKVY